jgi:hypothetical protein
MRAVVTTGGGTPGEVRGFVESHRPAAHTMGRAGVRAPDAGVMSCTNAVMPACMGHRDWFGPADSRVRKRGRYRCCWSWRPKWMRAAASGPAPIGVGTRARAILADDLRADRVFGARATHSTGHSAPTYPASNSCAVHLRSAGMPSAYTRSKPMGGLSDLAIRQMPQVLPAHYA